MRWFLPLLVLGGMAAADEFDDTVAQTLEAIRAEEPAVLRTLAQQDEPDPWLVAAALCVRGEFDAAEAFARAAPRTDTARLPDAVDAWRKSPADPAAWKRLVEAEAALAKGDATAAGRALADLEFPEGSLASVRLLGARARATRAPAGFAEAAKAAEELGWIRRAAGYRHEQSKALEHAGEDAEAVAAANAWLDLETRRGMGADLPRALTETGRLHLLVERWPEAEDLLRRALRQAQRAEDGPAVARAQALLGHALARQGARQDARVYLLRARGELEHDPEQLFPVLELLIDLDRDLDGLERGLARARELRDRARKAKAPAAEGAAAAAIARMELERKDLRAAANAFAEAEDAWGRANDPIAAARVGAERGELALRMGRLDVAAEALRGALARIGPEGPAPVRARLHAALGDWAIEAGRTEEAQTHLDAAAKLAKATDDAALAARTLARRGRLALREGKYDEARGPLAKALEEARNAGRDADVARTLADLAEIDGAQGRKDKAREEAAESRELARHLGDRATFARAVALDARTRLDDEDADALIERVRIGTREALELEGGPGGGDARFEAALAELLRVGTDAAIRANDEATLLAAGEFGRSRRMLQALGGRDALMAAMTPDELEDRIAKLAVREKEAIAEYQKQRERMARDAMLRAREVVKKLEAEREALEAERLSSLEPARWLLSPGVPTIEALQGALAPSETLLYYCVGTESVAVLKVTASGARILRVGDRAAIDEEVGRVREAMAGDDPYPALKLFDQHHLGLLALVAGRDLVLVTAPPFDEIPFAAVAPENTVRYAASAADVVRLAAEGRETGTGILGVGDPEFGGDEARLRLVHLRGGIPLRRLETMTALAQELGDAVLVGVRANEAMFRTALRGRERWHAIHFAVPGVLDARAPFRSALSLAAGADEDGILTAYDLLALRLPADLTVLSACEPAKGTREPDRAVSGLTQSIHLAGSARVLVCPWWVEDEAASALMKHFYRFWAEGDTPAPLALRRAQQKVSGLPGWVHPKSWAGWKLWGAR